MINLETQIAILENRINAFTSRAPLRYKVKAMNDLKALKAQLNRGTV